MSAAGPAWLEIAWADEGVAEVEGRAANDTILGYFRDAGRDDITSDEVSWCAAFVGACLARAGVPVALSHDQRLMAFSYLKVCTQIDTPRVGAIAVFWRGDPNGWTGHVGFVVGSTTTHIAVLGGNQANQVCVRKYPRDRLLGLRWPGEPVTPGELAAGGSRIAKAAKTQQVDVVKVAGAGTLGGAGLVAPPSPPDLSAFASQAGALQSAVETIDGFVKFAWGKGGWIAGALIVYWLGRMAWSAGWIGHWRAEDASTGKTMA